MNNEAIYFRHLFQGLPAGVVLLDRHDCVIDCNHGFVDLFGYKREETLGNKINDLIVPDHLKNEGWDATSKVASGKSVDLETVRKTKNNRLIHVSITGRPFTLQSGELSVIAIYQDISTKKQTELALRENEEKLRTIFTDANLGISITDRQGRILFNNKWYRDYLGYSAEELKQKTIEDLTHPDDLALTRKYFLDLVEGKRENYRLEKRYVRKDGQCVWGDLSVSVLKDADGNVKEVIGMITDITAKKNVELSLKENEQRLKELNQSKDTLISILSHDLRSPFNGILGFADILHNDVDSLSRERIRELVDIIRSQALHAYSLLEDVLEWVMLQSDKVPPKPSETDVLPICSSVVSNLKPKVDEKHISISCPAASSGKVYADEHMLYTVLNNLVSNAIKFSHEHGRIDIQAEPDGNYMVFSVSDNGLGIKPDDLPLIWNVAEKYTTTGTRGEKGTGFGLLICRELVEKLGGRIWVDSEPGNGTTFYFTVPLEQTSEPQAEPR